MRDLVRRTSRRSCFHHILISYISVDARISFPSGLTISWQGKPLGKVSLSDVDVIGDVGGIIDVESRFDVLDVGHLTDFTKVCMFPGSRWILLKYFSRLF